MSEIKKLNGYTIKDETARNDIGVKQNLNTDVKTDLVSAINEHETNINNMSSEKPYYKELNPIQAISMSLPMDTSIQGMCVDDNSNVYIYVIDDGTYGTLYVYNLISKTLVDTIEDVPFYHGNGMCYKNGKIYVAPAQDGSGNNTNKSIIIYDIETGNVNTINPFSTLSYANSLCICDFDRDNVIVGMYETSSDTQLSKAHFIKLNVNNLDIQEIDTQYYTFISPAQCGDIMYLNNKFYVITNSQNYIIEYTYDETNNKFIQNKNYMIPLKDSLGLEIKEIEGISIIPSGLFGNKSFVFSSYKRGNQNHGKSNYNVYFANLESDLFNPFEIDISQSNVSSKYVNLYVNSSATTNIENGTQDYPFKDINRAIECANSGVLNVDKIYIMNADTYELGYHVNKTFEIRALNNVQVTLKADDFINCNVKIVGSSITLTRTSVNVLKIYVESSQLVLENCTLTTYLECSRGTRLFINGVNMNVDYSYANAILLQNSYATLNIGTLSIENATRLLNAQLGSYAIINHAHATETVAKLSGSVVTIADV